MKIYKRVLCSLWQSLMVGNLLSLLDYLL
uniref:Uncharacterized protein n=1 Tax=Lotus japonicus TaxID=34305 RepID=I3SCQ3_LOTJA|nr:unknown [Lotus japonicus]